MPQRFPSEKIADRGRNLRGVGYQGKMAGVEEAHDRSRDVALERLGARRQEEEVRRNDGLCLRLRRKPGSSIFQMALSTS